MNAFQNLTLKFKSGNKFLPDRTVIKIDEWNELKSEREQLILALKKSNEQLIIAIHSVNEKEFNIRALIQRHYDNKELLLKLKGEK